MYYISHCLYALSLNYKVTVHVFLSYFHTLKNDFVCILFNVSWTTYAVILVGRVFVWSRLEHITFNSKGSNCDSKHHQNETQLSNYSCNLQPFVCFFDSSNLLLFCLDAYLCSVENSQESKQFTLTSPYWTVEFLFLSCIKIFS